jgi:hypothetical protein
MTGHKPLCEANKGDNKGPRPTGAQQQQESMARWRSSTIEINMDSTHLPPINRAVEARAHLGEHERLHVHSSS